MASPVITEDFGFSTETGQRIRNLATTSGSTIAVNALCIQQKSNDNGQPLTYQRCID
jgi:hypothetical protein